MLFPLQLPAEHLVWCFETPGLSENGARKHSRDDKRPERMVHFLPPLLLLLKLGTKLVKVLINVMRQLFHRQKLRVSALPAATIAANLSFDTPTNPLEGSPNPLLLKSSG